MGLRGAIKKKVKKAVRAVGEAVPGYGDYAKQIKKIQKGGYDVKGKAKGGKVSIKGK